MNVSYFNYEEGLDEEICELLNLRLTHITNDFNLKLKDFDDKVQ